jgi:MIP family channel proteins
MFSRPQKLVAEFIGTFALIFMGAGSICADQFLKASTPGGLGLLGIAAAYGLAMAIMVTAIGHISGGHFNPAITIGFWVTRKISTFDALLYWIAQLAGGAVAAFTLKWTVPEDIWRAVSLGTPALTHDLTRTTGMAVEAVTTFFLVFTVFATAVDERGAFNKIAGFAIGLSITMGALMAGPFTGAALNPARAFGPALAAHDWANHGVYWAGPLIGGVVAGWLYDSMFLRKA